MARRMWDEKEIVKIAEEHGGGGGPAPANMMTTNTNQTITGIKTFRNTEDAGIEVEYDSDNSAGILLTDVETGHDLHIETDSIRFVDDENELTLMLPKDEASTTIKEGYKTIATREWVNVHGGTAVLTPDESGNIPEADRSKIGPGSILYVDGKQYVFWKYDDWGDGMHARYTCASNFLRPSGAPGEFYLFGRNIRLSDGYVMDEGGFSTIGDGNWYHGKYIDTNEDLTMGYGSTRTYINHDYVKFETSGEGFPGHKTVKLTLNGVEVKDDDAGTTKTATWDEVLADRLPFISTQYAENAVMSDADFAKLTPGCTMLIMPENEGVSAWQCYTVDEYGGGTTYWFANPYFTPGRHYVFQVVITDKVVRRYNV